MKIFAAHGRTGAAWYRVRLPLGELGGQLGFEVTLRPGHERISAADFAGADVIVGQRVDSLARWSAAGAGAALVYEIDDDIFSIPPESKLAYADYRRPGVLDGATACLRRADLVTVSTEPLAEVMRQVNPNVAVLPNYVPSAAFDRVRTEGTLRLGWAGGVTHARNVESVAVPVRRFLRRFPEWSLRLVGTDYRGLFGYVRSEYVGWIDIGEQVQRYYQALDFDIGLAPLIESPFNRCKSPLRVLECAARGIPVVASDVTPYREAVQDGVTGFLVRREHEWLARLGELAADEGLRVSMGTAARGRARANAGWRPWAQAYRDRLG